MIFSLGSIDIRTGKDRLPKQENVSATSTVDRQSGFTNINDAIAQFAPKIMDENPRPTVGGRTSLVNQSNTLYSLIMSEMDVIKPEFQLELLQACSYLAKFNGDVSYAVDNIVQLANTPCTITFDDSVKKEQAVEMIKYLTVMEKQVYKGGMNSYMNDLMVQIAVKGAASTEAIPDKQLTKVAKVVIVDPYYIRFKYNPETFDYDPYQQVRGIGYSSRLADLKKLNLIQYKYYALRRMDDNPYGIPPFISAFESIELEKDMLKNMRNIIRKLGVFGFLQVLINAPQRKQNDTDDSYYARCMDYLEKIRPEIEKGFSSGLSIGFKGAHEFKMEGNNANVQGARELLNMITEMKHAGLKQDPLMLGRNFNVAETMARVIMAKLTTQIGNFQRLGATVRADIYLLMLIMGGYKLRSVTVEYDAPMIGDKYRDEQAYKLKIENRLVLRDKGIINQEDVAAEVGYEEAHADKDVDYSVPSAANIAEKEAAKIPKRDPDQASDATASGSTDYGMTLEFYRANLHKGIPEYIYDDEAGQCCNSNAHISYAAEGEDAINEIDEFILLYKSAIVSLYKKSINKVTLQIGEALAEMSPNATLQQVTDKIFYIMYKEWDASFTKAQKNIISKWVKNIYSFFRRDTSYMKGVAELPEAVFNLFDVRAITYFQNSDALYLGKFITDKDVTQSVTEFIKKKYLQENTPIGNNPEAIAAFREEFTNLMYLEDWKIRRIIDTSVNRMRNYGAVAFMNQAQVMEFEIRGVVDAKQCKYCYSLQGKRFKVDLAFQQAEKVTKFFPEFVAEQSPFVTSVYGGADGLERFINASEDQLQASGVAIPPYHPHCRDVIIAVL